jgi:UDP-2,3-diacylglucosamine pyrophosphatase LpxH
MYRQKEIKTEELKLEDGIVIIGSDVHIPFQDMNAVEAFIEYCAEIQPAAIILNGDVLDFYKLSRFVKGEGRNPYEEITACQEFLGALRLHCPISKVYYVIGNHETRLTTYVLNNAPHLASLVEDVFSIIKTEELGVKGCAEVIINDNFVCTHGKLLGSKAGLSAIKEIEKHYMSGASGHTHRLAKFITRKARRKFVWLETGCLCDLNPEYVQDPDWQQGFAVIQFEKGKLKRAEVVEIEDGEVL